LQPSSHRNLRSEIELLAVVVFWGLNFVVVKLVLEVMHPHVMNIFRLLGAAAVLCLIYWYRIQQSDTPFWGPLTMDARAIIRLSLIGWVLYQAAFITGLDYTSAGNGAIIMSSAPIWTALLSLVMGTEQLSAKAWTGLVISIVGTATVVAFGTAEIDLSSDLLIGNIIVLVAAMLWGSYTALTRPVVQKHSPLSLTVIALLLCLPPLALLAIPYWSETDWESMNALYWFAVFFSGALSTGIAIVFWNNAVRNLGASHTAAFGNLVPLIALVSGFIILGDPILPAQLIGGTLIISGLVIMRWARKNNDPTR
jgi:drug/metabolite transporter (DMT)-like permease